MLKRLTGNLTIAERFEVYPDKILAMQPGTSKDVDTTGCKEYCTDQNLDKTLPNTITKIRDFAFYRDTSLTQEIVTSSDNPFVMGTLNVNSLTLYAKPNSVLALPTSEEYEQIYHLFVIRCERRDELEKYLNENGIGTLKHYPIPMHEQECYKDLGIKHGELPIAEEISRTVLSIPMYYGMTDEQIDYVIDKINKFM